MARTKKKFLTHPVNPTADMIERFSDFAHNDREFPLHPIRKVAKTPLVAMNQKQKDYIKAITNNPLTIVHGPSGSGKTYIAAKMAADMLTKGKVDSIVLTKPNVSQSKTLGYFKGTLEDKLAPWAAPYTSIIRQELGDSYFEYLVKRETIQLIPVEVLRGRSFEKAFILLDEAQNTTVGEMKCFLTRIGQKCTVVMNGDVRQKDIKSESGLKKTIDLAAKYDIVLPVIEFDYDDIVRSAICREWVIAFDSDEDGD